MPAIGQGSGKAQRPAKRLVKAPTKAPSRTRSQAPTLPPILPAPKRAPSTPASRPRAQIRPSVTPSPDTRDISARSPAQHRQDAQAVKQTVRAQRVKALRKGEVAPKQPRVVVSSYDSRRVSHENAVKLAPVIKVLSQTTRPLHAIAGAAEQDVHVIKAKGLGNYLIHGGGHPALKAAEKGIRNQSNATFSDVLTEAGWKPHGTLGKIAKGAASLTADIAADPLTYTTGGTGKVGELAGEAAAKRVGAKAIAKGLSKDQAARFAERARIQAAKRAEGKGSGVTVKLAGQEVPGVRRATAAAGRAGGKTLRKAVPQGARDAARAVTHEVNPDVAPVGVPKTAYREQVMAARSARGAINQGERRAADIGHGIRKRIGEKNYPQVVDAIEAGRIGKLPEELRGPAHALRNEMHHRLRSERATGVRIGEVGVGRSVHVPQVTADVNQSARDLAKAHRRAIAARRNLADLREEHAVAQGRAEVLSRNVNGRTAEQAAQRAYGLRRVAGSRAGQHRSPRDVLAYLDRVESGQRYAGGGHGVLSTQQAIHDAEQHAKSAQAAHDAAHASHEATKAAAAAQRRARDKAIQHNERVAAQPKGYLPHPLTEQGQQEVGRQVGETNTARTAGAAGAGGRRTLRPASARSRNEERNRPLNVLHEQFPGQYRTDLHGMVSERVAQGHRTEAQAGLNRALARLGTPVGKGGEIPAGATVYHIKGSNIREVTDRAEKQAILDTGHGLGQAGNGGRYVILHKQLVDDALRTSAPTLKGPGIVHGFDKATSAFKRLAIATPAFHVRNFVGDTSQAATVQPLRTLPGNLRTAKKLTHAAADAQKATRRLEPRPAPSGETLHLPRYGHVALEDIAHRLAKAGASGSGYTAGELRELSTSGGLAGNRVARTLRKGRGKAGQSPAGQAAKRATITRENLPRLATALHALKNGATYEQAASAVSRTHFDYQHLTTFERQVARRLMPFYTWSARNIPFQARNLIAHPGKYAAYEKVREEATKSFQPQQAGPHAAVLYKALGQAGAKLPGDWQRYVTDYEQRNAGIPVSWKGHKFTVSMSLPLVDLNEIPGAAGKQQLSEYAQKAASLVSPLIKDPLEIATNYSTFFRGPIESDTSPLVQAPTPVGSFPAAVKKRLGIVRGIDKKAGKAVWMWPGKVDYVAHAISPGLAGQAMSLFTQHNRQGRSGGGQALALSGVKSTPVDAVNNAVSLAYQRQTEIQKRMAALRQQQVPGKGYSPAVVKEYRLLEQQLALTTRIIYAAKFWRGDKVLPKR